MRHDKSWSFDQIMKLKGSESDYGAPREFRIGVRDLSIIDSEDRHNVRFRKSKDGVELRIYSRIVVVKGLKRETCDLGHEHHVTTEKTFCWFNMTLTPKMLGQLQEWLTDGHHKWRDLN